MNDTAPPPTSPIIWSFPDYLGRTLDISILFNEANGNLTGVTAIRQTGCLYRKLYFGVGPDGIPDNTPKKVTVPFGTTNVTKAQLSAIGLNTLNDVLALQFTVGP